VHATERLLAGMTHAVADLGYTAAAVGHVIAHAGVSRPTFHDYFTDEADCFVATLVDIQERLIADVRNAVLGELTHHATHAAVATLAHFADHSRCSYLLSPTRRWQVGLALFAASSRSSRPSSSATAQPTRPSRRPIFPLGCSSEGSIGFLPPACAEVSRTRPAWSRSSKLGSRVRAAYERAPLAHTSGGLAARATSCRWSTIPTARAASSWPSAPV
jgi:AcrR family transcriptional regulator